MTNAATGNNTLQLATMAENGDRRALGILLRLFASAISGASPGALVYEASADNLTAHAAGGQANALQLTNELNRISTVATAGDSVKLPASGNGLTVIVENAGANSMQVFGSGTDQINGAAAATGISQMPNSVVIYTCYTAGNWFANGLGTGYSGSLESMSLLSGLTALAAGTQAGATALTAMVNIITTAASAGASVALPSLTLPNGVAVQISVINNGANSTNVFCPVGGTMNGTANGSSALAAASVGLYYCSGTNAWVSK
jgi:hypothetical protein